MKRNFATLVCVLMAGASACKQAPPPPPPVVARPAPTPVPPVSVSAVTLGSAILENKTISAAKETFGVKDTIYASVATAGVGHAKLRAEWTFAKGDKSAKVNETTMEFDSAQPAVNEFHISKPSAWPKGAYRVDIYLNDATTPSASKSFTVS